MSRKILIIIFIGACFFSIKNVANAAVIIDDRTPPYNCVPSGSYGCRYASATPNKTVYAPGEIMNIETLATVYGWDPGDSHSYTVALGFADNPNVSGAGADNSFEVANGNHAYQAPSIPGTYQIKAWGHFCYSTNGNDRPNCTWSDPISIPYTVGSSYIELLRVNQGTETSPNIVGIAGEQQGTVTSPLRIAKNGIVYGIVLVDPADPMASKVRIQLGGGIVKALRKY